jgi:hypothetical protein
MRRNFITNGLQISLSRNINDETFTLDITSDYSRSNHKGQLYVNGKELSKEVESLWKSIKTKKLMKLCVNFDEIDWYDNMTDIYTTPIVKIERGQKIARTFEREHGSIPKDWSINLTALISNTTTKTPILEVVKKTLGYYFTPALEKEFVKKLKPVLQKKSRYAMVETPYGDDY